MTNSATLVPLLTPAVFERRAARWATYLSSPGSDDLRRSFRRTGATGQEELLTYVSFPIQTIIYLASTVGARHIQARFLISLDNGQPHFTLALYATDMLGQRVSAYYAATEYWSSPVTPPLPADQAPHDLVKTWLTNWTSAPDITPALFANSYGPLQGYTFPLNDFMEPLFEAQPFTPEQEVRAHFGLHQYYPATPAKPELKQTFGLVLRLYPPSKPAPTSAGAPVTSGDPFFDLSTPCPPGTM